VFAVSDVILSKIKLLVANHFDVDSDHITLETNFCQTLGADSLDLIELNMAVARHFDIDVIDGEMNKIHTVGELTTYDETHWYSLVPDSSIAPN
jgi:acyl carrier protein